MRVRCPHCSEMVEAPAGWDGAPLACPRCATEAAMPGGPGLPAEPLASQPPPVPPSAPPAAGIPTAERDAGTSRLLRRHGPYRKSCRPATASVDRQPEWLRARVAKIEQGRRALLYRMALLALAVLLANGLVAVGYHVWRGLAEHRRLMRGKEAHVIMMLMNAEDAEVLPRRFMLSNGGVGTVIAGYRFMAMRTAAGRAVDWTEEFATYAAPVEYGVTGRHCFIIARGRGLWQKDVRRPVRVEDFPADPVAQGWEPVEIVVLGRLQAIPNAP